MLSRLCTPKATAPLQHLSLTSLIGNGQVQIGLFNLNNASSSRFLTTSPRSMTSLTKPLGAYKEGPERDLVNFPRPQRLLTNPPVKFGFLPEDWFKFFYPKTGVTGPYVFGAGFLTYLLSKEIWVLEHEFWNGISLLIIIMYVTKKFGPDIKASLIKDQDTLLANLNAGKTQELEALREAIEAEKTAQLQAEGAKMLFEVKRENVALQLEAVYRQRLVDVYTEVKKRLDYQVDKQHVERNIQQKHMVRWIIAKVQKAITPESEQENLKKCIADLKGLAATY